MPLMSWGVLGPKSMKHSGQVAGSSSVGRTDKDDNPAQTRVIGQATVAESERCCDSIASA